jgi:hypothetical protein
MGFFSKFKKPGGLTSGNERSEIRVVDNRVFLLGLDELYCNAMKQHEREELLKCARYIANALNVSPGQVPIEGYYTEDELLSEYFLLVRALQNVENITAPGLSSSVELKRLRDIMSAPIFGCPQYIRNGRTMLFPTGCDALSQALNDTYPEWTVENLIIVAHRIAHEKDDISLVGLAARIKDPVLLAALRESVVLYADIIVGAVLNPPKPKYVWAVDEDLSSQAKRFIDTFNRLFDNELPPPDQSQVERYWQAYKDNEIHGRCVRLGYDDSHTPIRHYHWGIYRTYSGEPALHEFWSSKIWTTAEFRRLVPSTWGLPQLPPEHKLH